MWKRRVLAGFLLVLSSRGMSAQNGSVKLYVAASTREAVDAALVPFRSETGIAVEVNPGASSKLAKQILEGGPADLFLSADQVSVAFLEDQHLVAKRRDLLGNRLVVVTPAATTGGITSLADLERADIHEVAVAIEKVPAGEYAREALRAAGVWDRIADKVVGGEDVRATLALVERGASAGIVYLTDTIGNSSVRVAVEIDSKLHQPIVYPLVWIQREPVNSAAARVYEYLGSERARQAFRAARFELVD